MATISSEKSRAVKISLTPGHVVLSANSPEAGSATEELEAKYDGALLDVGFNARYMLDILQQIEGDRARSIWPMLRLPLSFRTCRMPAHCMC